jgi:hypothetical protein
MLVDQNKNNNKNINVNVNTIPITMGSINGMAMINTHLT